jgi:ribosomal protein S8
LRVSYYFNTWNVFRARHHHVCVAHTMQNLSILSILLCAGFLTNVTCGTTEAPSPEAFHAVGEAQRRIWADLKYRNDRPVLEQMGLISKSIFCVRAGRHLQGYRPGSPSTRCRGAGHSQHRQRKHEMNTMCSFVFSASVLAVALSVLS